MSQTSAIAAGLVIAFIVFVTVKSELPCYLEVMGISTGGSCKSGCSGLQGTSFAQAASYFTGGAAGSGGSGGVQVGVGPGGIGVRGPGGTINFPNPFPTPGSGPWSGFGAPPPITVLGD